jgi:thiol-disulfide isomerase/thioredoxin
MVTRNESYGNIEDDFEDIDSDEIENIESNRYKEMRPRSITDSKSDQDTKFKFRQKLAFIIVIGTLLIGTAAGSYGFLEELMFSPCLGCLGLYPNVELEFGFDTVEDQAHPEFILDNLTKKGPIFIEFTQNDENCPPCKRMRPKVRELEDEFSQNVYFMIINVNENEMAIKYKNEDRVEDVTDDEESEYYHIYDRKLIAGGRVATPTYIIITLDEDKNDKIRPSFAVGYGEYKNDDAEDTKNDLSNALNIAIKNYDHYIDDYKSK